MANDEVHAAIAVEHALRACNKINPTDTIVTLLPTCPLRTSDDIREACRIYRDPYIAAASVISVCAGPPQNRIRTITEQGEVSSLEGVRAHPLSQNAAKTFIVNGAVFITSPDKLRQGFRAMPCFPYIMPVSRSIDIDTEEDWQMAERTFKAIFPG
jgi:N-acylneuraminate cytidylyltransferase